MLDRKRRKWKNLEGVEKEELEEKEGESDIDRSGAFSEELPENTSKQMDSERSVDERHRDQQETEAPPGTEKVNKPADFGNEKAEPGHGRRTLTLGKRLAETRVTLTLGLGLVKTRASLTLEEGLATTPMTLTLGQGLEKTCATLTLEKRLGETYMTLTLGQGLAKTHLTLTLGERMAKTPVTLTLGRIGRLAKTCVALTCGTAKTPGEDSSDADNAETSGQELQDREHKQPRTERGKRR